MWGGQSGALFSYRNSSYCPLHAGFTSDLKAQRVLTSPILPRTVLWTTTSVHCHITLEAPCYQGTPTCSISYSVKYWAHA